MEAATPEEVLAALPEAIRAEHDWLELHGARPAWADEPIEIEETERIDLATDVSRGIWRGLFRYEVRPTSETDVEIALERTRFAREDLLDRLPPTDSPLPEALAERLTRHAEEEWTLLSRLGSRPGGRLPEEPRERIALVRERAEERLRHLLPGDRERHAVFQGEEWTTRKVLRCLAVGERMLWRDVAAWSAIESSRPEG